MAATSPTPHSRTAPTPATLRSGTRGTGPGVGASTARADQSTGPASGLNSTRPEEGSSAAANSAASSGARKASSPESTTPGSAPAIGPVATISSTVIGRSPPWWATRSKRSRSNSGSDGASPGWTARRASVMACWTTDSGSAAPEFPARIINRPR